MGFRGLYAIHLRSLIEAGVPPSRILVICFEEFAAENRGFLEALHSFVGVEHVDKPRGGRWADMKWEVHDVEVDPEAYRARKKLPRPTRLAELESLFQEWNDVLRSEFGVDCGWTR